jgi:hypothetical protein
MTDILTSPEVYSAVVRGAISLLRQLVASEELGIACILMWFIWLLRDRLIRHIDRMEDNRPIRDQRFANNYSDSDQAIEDLYRGDEMLREHGLDAIVDSMNLTTTDILSAISNLV